MLTHPPPSRLRPAKGAGKPRHINISTLWIQEKQDFHQLEMRKVLGTKNPADLMTKYLTRSVIDTHLQFMGHHRADGRAQAGLKVQGKTATAVKGRAGGHPNPGDDPTNSSPNNPATALCFSKVRGSDTRGTPNRGASPPAHSRCYCGNPQASAGGRINAHGCESPYSTPYTHQPAKM